MNEDTSNATTPRVVAGGGAAKTTTCRDAFERTDAVLVRYPIRPGETGAVCDLVERRSAEAGDGVGWILDGDDVATVSVFVERTDDPALEFYVEVTGEWTDPAAELQRRSPLFEAGLDEFLDPPERGVDASRRVVHVHNPERPGTPGECDVVLVRLGIRPGVGTGLARLLAGLVDRVQDSWLGRGFRRSTLSVVRDERMWTETLWLERTDGSHAVQWYMEADDLDHVTEAFEASDEPVARWLKPVLDPVFEVPVEGLDDPGAASDRDLLAHATDPSLR